MIVLKSTAIVAVAVVAAVPTLLLTMFTSVAFAWSPPPPPHHHPVVVLSSSTTTSRIIRSTTTTTQLYSTTKTTSSTLSCFSFDELSKFDGRLEALEEEATGGLTTTDGNGGFLMDYYDERLMSFSIAPGTAEELSITSTAYSARCLLEYPATMAPYNKVDLTRALINSNWRPHDLYQVSLILLVVLRLDPNMECIQSSSSGEKQADRAKFSELVTLVLSGRPQRRRGERQQFSAYIQYLCASVYGDLMKLPTILDELVAEGLLPDTTRRDINVAAVRSAEVSHMELCRQLAYRSAGDQALFDVIKLIYSMLTYLKSTQAIQETTRSNDDGSAGRQLVELLDLKSRDTNKDNDNVSKDGEEENNSQNEISVINAVDDNQQQNNLLQQVNPNLVQAGLRAFFEEQDINGDGLWSQGQPIYRAFRRKGRNIGNAYVFGIDALGSLLEMLPAEEFRPYLSNLERTLQWMESNLKVDIVPDYCDPETGKCYGKILRGWASSHLLASPPPGNGPKAWSTAQTMTCLARMRQVVRSILHQDVLEEFRGQSLSKNGPSDVAWDRLLDSDVGSTTTTASAAAGEDGTSTQMVTLKSVLENRVVGPFAAGASTPSIGACYSTILFGSPGTAKTTIVQATAEKLGWDFLTIDTAVFLEDGLTNVAARIRYVFRRLEALRNCVILFDEIEEFCLNRETPGISMESRMLTTAMLTAINDLRRRKQSVFFLATNRLRAFDAAIIRPGRFDMQLFVGTPNLEARVILLNQALASNGVDLSPEERNEAIDTYVSFLQSVWSQDAMFFNYLEGKQFATSVATILGSGRKMTQDELRLLLSQQAAVMTARGAVRDEYIAQMDLSRF